MALRNSAYVNVVSKLHQRVSRKMWSGLWPDLSEIDIPIGCVTNGIHIPPWISGDLATVFDRYLDSHWAEDPDNQNTGKWLMLSHIQKSGEPMREEGNVWEVLQERSLKIS